MQLILPDTNRSSRLCLNMRLRQNKNGRTKLRPLFAANNTPKVVVPLPLQHTVTLCNALYQSTFVVFLPFTRKRHDFRAKTAVYHTATKCNALQHTAFVANNPSTVVVPFSLHHNVKHCNTQCHAATLGHTTTHCIRETTHQRSSCLSH